MGKTSSKRCAALTGVVLLLFAAAPIFGHQAHDQAPKDTAATTLKTHDARGHTDRSPRKGSAGSRWGADYFPNVLLTTHEGETVRFFDDMIKDKVVVINFIYTTCPDSCPLETAKLVTLQKLLGDRVGQDVFMYSITIDPEHDTVAVLKAYAEKFKIGPGWWFLTGKEEDVTLLRRKLGIYVEAIEENASDHQLSIVIGNQRTGRWIKRSPFENSYFLAEQVGSWLHNWKKRSKYTRSYADAGKLRNMSPGEALFRTRCTACHTIGDGDIRDAARGNLGPDLLGVTRRRDRERV